LGASIDVLPAWRRKGVGKELLEKIHGLMRVHGKSIVTSWAYEPDGHGFLRHIGAAIKSAARESRLVMDQAPWELLYEWENRALAARPGAKFGVYPDRIPEARLSQLLTVINSLMEDQPLDDLELPPFHYFVEAYEERYRDFSRQGGANPFVLLEDADGSVCGLTEAG
jgi:hypothetical protein